jgi:hypothetical protein
VFVYFIFSLVLSFYVFLVPSSLQLLPTTMDTNSRAALLLQSAFNLSPKLLQPVNHTPPSPSFPAAYHHPILLITNLQFSSQITIIISLPNHNSHHLKPLCEPKHKIKSSHGTQSSPANSHSIPTAHNHKSTASINSPHLSVHHRQLQSTNQFTHQTCKSIHHNHSPLPSPPPCPPQKLLPCREKERKSHGKKRREREEERKEKEGGGKVKEEEERRASKKKQKKKKEEEEKTRKREGKTGKARKKKKKIKRLTGPKPKSRPKPTSKYAKDTHQGPIAQAQSELGSHKSKAQLKWAPATSKDGSDYDPPSPVRYS